MIAKLVCTKCHIVALCLLLALLLSGCGKPAPESAKDASPAKPVAQANPGVATVEMDAAQAAERILNAAHRSGAVILRGPCGAPGAGDPYPMHPPIALEPMD